MDVRTLMAGVSALLTAIVMGAGRVLSRSTPGSTDADTVASWFDLHGSMLGWRALVLALAAVGVVAFAASFREGTWAASPGRLWTGTVMVLAALGYAALISVAVAVDLALMRSLQSATPPSTDLLVTGAFLQRSLVVVATPALVVVLLGAAVPLVQWSTAGRVAAAGAAVVAVALSNPWTWAAGLDLTPAWFVLAGTVVLVSGPRSSTRDVVTNEPHAVP